MVEETRVQTGVQVTDPAGPSAATGAGGPTVNPTFALVYGRVLGGDASLAQVWFDQRVLDRYRTQAGYRVIRTNSAGRVQIRGGWTLDFGITEDSQLIHASAADLAQRLPAAERRHWASFLVGLPVSQTFLTMRLGAGHCLDDGDVRTWSEEPSE